MLHSGCVKLHQKFRDFVGLPMGLLREESQKNRMNTGLFGSRSGEYGIEAVRSNISLVLDSVLAQNSYMTGMTRTNMVLNKALKRESLSYTDAIYLRSTAIISCKWLMFREHGGTGARVLDQAG